MDSDRKLTKAQKRELRKQEWQQKAEADKKQEQFKKIAIWVGAALVMILAIAGLAFLVNSSPTSSSQPINVAPVSDKDITNGVKDSKVTLMEYADSSAPPALHTNLSSSRFWQNTMEKYCLYLEIIL